MDLLNASYRAAVTRIPYMTSKSSSSPTPNLSLLRLRLDPWSWFHEIWTTVMGYPPKDFNFVQGETLMSTNKEMVAAIIVYYLVVLGGREIMRGRQPYKLKRLFLIHNFYLTAISGVLLGLFVQQLAPRLWQRGLYDCICYEGGWSQELLVLYYLNYLTKFLELLDTVFLVLKKKPLTFLHTYHHGATALLCYSQLAGRTSVQWVPITLNLTVHVVMYWYYFQSARGIKVWWKQYITILQIAQFLLDLGFIYFACYNYYAFTYHPATLPHYGTCGETKQEIHATIGCLILSSYLVLFILFYFSTYGKPSAKKALRKASKVEMPNVDDTKEMAADCTDALRSVSNKVREVVNDDAGFKCN